MITGEKYIAFRKTMTIHSMLKTNNVESAHLIVSLVYSINAGKFKIPLSDKLSEINSKFGMDVSTKFTINSAEMLIELDRKDISFASLFFWSFSRRWIC